MPLNVLLTKDGKHPQVDAASPAGTGLLVNGFVTTARHARVTDLPLSFAQTELRAGKSIVISKLLLEMHQRLELRTLTISMVAVLTPGVIPVYLNTAMQACSVGLYRGTMITGPLAYAAFADQTATVNPFAPCVIESPGAYSVIVSNNTSNIDLAVAATGSIKFYC